MSSKIFVGIMAALVVGILGVALTFKSGLPEKQPHTNNRGAVHEFVTYKSPTCGCCTNWVGHMRAKGYDVEVIDTDEVEAIKEQYGVPESLYACHTTIVNGGEYFIEGHIPEESIIKMLEEMPDIKGIGMPGMPEGSPGMPGSPAMPFEIMQVDDSEKLDLFERI